jgi:hypothetical protein
MTPDKLLVFYRLDFVEAGLVFFLLDTITHFTAIIDAVRSRNRAGKIPRA